MKEPEIFNRCAWFDQKHDALRCPIRTSRLPSVRHWFGFLCGLALITFSSVAVGQQSRPPQSTADPAGFQDLSTGVPRDEKGNTALSDLPTFSEPVSQSDEVDRADVPKLGQLETEIEKLKAELDSLQSLRSDDDSPPIKLSGAIRFQYSVEDYNAGNRDRGGDLDFDLFRLGLDGKIGDVELSAQYRWFQYMDVIHHAWIGFQVNELWKAEMGVTRVPFGNLPFNSHNFFFSSNFYVGLEDDYDAGIKLIRESENHDLRLGFFFTDEMGGIDGFVDNRTDRYSYDLVGLRSTGEGTFDAPAIQIAEHNGCSIRYAYQLPFVEVGGSFLYGDLRNQTGGVGDRRAFAFHLNSTIDRWNWQFQFTDYHYDVSGFGRLVVGAYSFFDTIPTKARLFNVNVAYDLPVEWGPISKLTFYNDYNIMTDKSGNLNEDSVMNVSGVAVTAGGVYAYFDLITATNHPFLGSSLAADDADWNTRLNVNIGYYF